MPDLTKFPFIWCENCGSIEPVVLSEEPADHHNDHPALDLVCSRCKFIVATLHAEKS